MGAVVRVRDAQRGTDVALKVLHDPTAEGLLHIKREFRALAGLAHPNLCMLYELDAVHDPPFFTMACIEGTDVVSALQDAPQEVCRRAARGLFTGLAALHRQGVLHRDVKPSNVMATPDGHVVLVDFGLALGAVARRAAAGGDMSGTFAYLAPEVAFGGPHAEASDLYSAGAVLYEAITQTSLASDNIAPRLERAIPHPLALCPQADPLLAKLAWDLLEPSPGDRPTLLQVLDRLSGEDVPMAHDAFVGRREELAALERALSRAQEGALHVSVTGQSGMGKSRLVREFLKTGVPDDVPVFGSRCHPHETTPFQALDGVMDAWVYEMWRRPTDWPWVDDLDPAVTAVFPVFELVSGARPVPDVPPAVMRSRAVRALRMLIREASAQRPVVIWIDDAHWADSDSLRLLEDLLAPPMAPGVVCITTQRPSTGEDAVLEKVAIGTHRVDVVLDALTEEASRHLLRTLVPAAPAEQIDTWLAASAGDPFLLASLASHPSEEALDHADREILLRAAIAGRPLSVAELSFQEEVVDPWAHVQRLEGMRLLQRDRHGRYFPYHDRAVQPWTRDVGEERIRRAHGCLADAFVQDGSGEPAHVLHHLERAGRQDEALPFALAGAQRALDKLAFERAATLLDTARRVGPPEGDRGLTRQLADALALAGRGRRAAELYISLVEGSEPDAVLELQQRACEQYLYSGHHDLGTQVARQVLRRVGTSIPGGPLRAAAEILWLDRTPRLRNLDVTDPEVHDQAALDRLDVLHAVSLGISFAQPITSAVLGYRHLYDGLRQGDPARVARALALYMVQAAFYAYDPKRSAEVRAKAEMYAARSDAPEAQALVRLASAGLGWGEGRYRECVDLTGADGVALTRDEPGLRWHRDTWDLVHLEGLICLGAFSSVADRMPDVLADARSRGDLHLEINILARVAPMLWLALDRPGTAREVLADVDVRWPSTGAGTIELLACLNGARVAHYEGDGAACWEVLEAGWKVARRALLLTMGFHKVLAWPVRARAAMEAERCGAVSSAVRRKVVRAALKQLTGVGPVGDAERGALLAEEAWQHGDRDGVRVRLEAAAEAYASLDMQAYAASSRLALDCLEGVEEVDARHWYGTGIRHPRRFARLIYPTIVPTPG